MACLRCLLTNTTGLMPLLWGISDDGKVTMALALIRLSGLLRGGERSSGAPALPSAPRPGAEHLRAAKGRDPGPHGALEAGPGEGDRAAAGCGAAGAPRTAHRFSGLGACAQARGALGRGRPR